MHSQHDDTVLIDDREPCHPIDESTTKVSELAIHAMLQQKFCSHTAIVIQDTQSLSHIDKESCAKASELDAHVHE